jgi:ubiquinone/menaquinone biosynthesis C-methylase UbiE
MLTSTTEKLTDANAEKAYSNVDYTIRRVNQHRLETLKKHGGHSILDVGCGNGSYVFELRDSKDIFGTDYFYFESWQQDPTCFFQCSADNLTVPDRSYDTVSAFELLEHMPDPRKVVRELSRVARKNVIISVPDCSNINALRSAGLAYSHWTDRTHVQFFTPKSLEQLLEECGLEVVELKRINQIKLGRLVCQTLHIPEFLFRFVDKVISLIIKDNFKMTLLVVARKRDE